MKVLVEKLNEPNINNRIYTTKCIKDAIINNPDVNEAINTKSCFVLKFNTWKSSTVLALDAVGIVNCFFIENNDGHEYLCADIDFNDKDYDKVYLAGFGNLSTTDTVVDYTFDYLFVEEGDINEK